MNFTLASPIQISLPTMTVSVVLFDTMIFYACYRFLRWVFIPLIFGTPLRNIPGPPPASWVMGNLGQLFNSKGLPFHQSLVDLYGGMVKVYGFFGDEQLYISDPHALQAIIIKEQDAFEETAVFIETNKAIFGPGLVATTGEHHKRQRKLVNPMFSVSQLRQLTPVFYEISEKLADVLSNEIREQVTASDDGASVLDMSEWVSRVALEMVGRTVLGYSFDPLDSPHNNPYTSAVKELIPTIFTLSLVRQFAPFLSKLGPPWFRRKLVELIPHKAVQKVKDMSDVMDQTAQKILAEKREQLAFENGSTDHTKPKDIITMLLRANENAKHGEQLSDAELTGQMTVLIFGAQDTTSSALSRIFHVLSAHPEAQSKLREEIREAFRDPRNIDEDFPSRLTYESVMALPWLDAVIKETLRLYPPVPFVRRTAVKERTIPYVRAGDCDKCNEESSIDLSSVTIPAGTTIFVGIAGSNRLEGVWGPDAKEWKPERWISDQSKGSDVRLPGIYSGMMSFLGGGRSCIGYKFALVEMKIVLATLFSRFSFGVTDDKIVWNLSQIISPSVQKIASTDSGEVSEERKALPLFVRLEESHP